MAGLPGRGGRNFAPGGRKLPSEDSAADPENLPSLIALYLLDLRTQYEQELRSLTDAQRAVEEYRNSNGPEGRIQAKAVLQQRFDMLRHANIVVKHGIDEAIAQIDKLSVEHPNMEPSGFSNTSSDPAAVD